MGLNHHVNTHKYGARSIVQSDVVRSQRTSMNGSGSTWSSSESRPGMSGIENCNNGIHVFGDSPPRARSVLGTLL